MPVFNANKTCESLKKYSGLATREATQNDYSDIVGTGTKWVLNHERSVASCDASAIVETPYVGMLLVKEGMSREQVGSGVVFIFIGWVFAVVSWAPGPSKTGNKLDSPDTQPQSKSGSKDFLRHCEH